MVSNGSGPENPDCCKAAGDSVMDYQSWADEVEEEERAQQERQADTTLTDPQQEQQADAGMREPRGCPTYPQDDPAAALKVAAAKPPDDDIIMLSIDSEDSWFTEEQPQETYASVVRGTSSKDRSCGPDAVQQPIVLVGGRVVDASQQQLPDGPSTSRSGRRRRRGCRGSGATKLAAVTGGKASPAAASTSMPFVVPRNNPPAYRLIDFLQTVGENQQVVSFLMIIHGQPLHNYSRGRVPVLSEDLIGLSLFTGNLEHRRGTLIRRRRQFIPRDKYLQQLPQLVFIDKFYNERNFRQLRNRSDVETALFSGPAIEYTLHKLARLSDVIEQSFELFLDHVKRNGVHYIAHRLPPALTWYADELVKYCMRRGVVVVCSRINTTVPEVRLCEDCVDRENHNSNVCEICLFHNYVANISRHLIQGDGAEPRT